MTDWYFSGYKITLALLRGGARVVVIRRATDNRYIRHFNSIAEFTEWMKGHDYVKVEYSEED